MHPDEPPHLEWQLGQLAQDSPAGLSGSRRNPQGPRWFPVADLEQPKEEAGYAQGCQNSGGARKPNRPENPEALGSGGLHPLFRSERVYEHNSGDFVTSLNGTIVGKVLRISQEHVCAKRMCYQNVRRWNFQPLEHCVEINGHDEGQTLATMGRTPTQPGAIITISCGEGRELRLNQTPIEAAIRNSGFEQRDRLSCAHQKSVQRTADCANQLSWRREFKSIPPAANSLGDRLKPQNNHGNHHECHKRAIPNFIGNFQHFAGFDLMGTCKNLVIW
jgi:hypothetical protein